MQSDDEKLMEYVYREVREACQVKSWGQQIRRNQSVRHKPVAQSGIEDYEWKLIPGATGELTQPTADSPDYDGTYYVLSVDKRAGKFVLQHDTYHLGMWGAHFEESTYTEIRIGPFLRHMNEGLPAGWLRDHLLSLVDRFGPNEFSIT
jgi:hypothetical protein